MMDAISSALAGMSAAEQKLDAAASQIARFPFASLGGDTVDLSAEAVALMEARNDHAANVKVVHTADEMTRTLLNMLG